MQSTAPIYNEISLGIAIGAEHRPIQILTVLVVPKVIKYWKECLFLDITEFCIC